MRSWNASSVDVRRRVVFCGTFALMMATGAWEFRQLSAGGPTNAASATAYRIGLAPGSEIAQTFNVPWNNFSRVRIRLAVEGQPRGILEVAIDRLTPPADRLRERDTRRVQMDVRRLGSDGDVELRFPPIPDSGGQRYRLRVGTLGVVSGIAVEANSEDTYPTGSLYLDQRQQPGDLVFTARSSTPTMAGLLQGALSGRPWPFSSPVTFWILAVLFCAAVSRLVVLAAEVTGALSR